jgi:hypothetical protein
MILSTFGRKLIALPGVDTLKTLLGINPITINNDNWSGADLTVPNGGTGVSSFTAYAVICGGTTATGNLQSIAGVGTSGHVLTSNGAGALPTFQATAAIDYGAGNAALAYGGIGTYVMGYISNNGVTENTNYAGSSIEPAGVANGNSTTAIADDAEGTPFYTKGGSALSGTWRAMGRANNDSGSARDRVTLFLRIS